VQVADALVARALAVRAGVRQVDHVRDPRLGFGRIVVSEIVWRITNEIC
jgi:hypothetical protein